MKIHPSHIHIKELIISALHASKDPVKLANHLGLIYTEINKQIPHAIPVTIDTIETESLRYSLFYQSGDFLSEHALRIEQLNYGKYIWIDNKEWNCEDNLFNIDEIAHELTHIPMITSIPESTKDIHHLIKMGLWSLNTEHLPTFSPTPPKDTQEVLSWDETHLLVGKTNENAEVVTRSFWQELCMRENNWFENKI